MLLQADVRWNVYAFKFLSKLYLLPFKFSPNTGKFIANNNRLTIAAGSAYLTLLLLFLGLDVLRVLHLYNCSDISQNFRTFALCFCSVLGYGFFIFQFFMLVRFRHTVVQILNYDFQILGEFKNRGNPQTWRRYTINEVLIVMMPLNLLLVTVFSMGLITLMPKEIFFPGLFGCPEQPFALWIFMMTFDNAMTAVAILPSIAIHFSWTLTFMALTAKLELQGNALRNGCDFKGIERIASNCREIQLQTLLFNYVNGTSLFVLKQLIHFGAVTFIFMALNWFEESWTESAMVLGIGCQLIAIYVLYFGRAFEIPEKALSVKNTMLIATHQSGGGDLKGKILAKKAIAIPYIGIRIGIFKYFEKESTLLFCSFVVDQVINLLISFR